MVPSIMVSLKITTLRDMEFINGLMEESLQVIGEIIRCMELVFSSGQMVEDMRAAI